MIRQEAIQFDSHGVSIRGRLFSPQQSQACPAVIICHGAFEYKEHFYELAEALVQQELIALVIDMHGHGESGGKRFHVKMNDWAEDVRCALKYLQQRTDVVQKSIGAFGFSSGGTAVLEAASAGVELKAVVTLDATVRSVLKWYEVPLIQGASLLGRIKKRLGYEDFQLPLLWALDSVRTAEDDAVTQTVREDPYLREAYSKLPLPGALECFVVDTVKRVAKITCPVCVIHGAMDQIDPPATAEVLFNHLTADKALHILPGSGHLGHMDRQKDEVIRLTCQWFKKRL